MYYQSQRQQYFDAPHVYQPPMQEPYRVAPVWSNTHSPQRPEPFVQAHQMPHPMPHPMSSAMPNTAQQHRANYFHPQQQASHIPPFLNNEPKKKKNVQKQRTHKDHFLKGVELFQKEWHETWIKQELNFSMNKISVAGLLFGLMFLGSVFFLIGFLVAFNLYSHNAGNSAVAQVYRSVMPSQTAVISGTGGAAPNAQHVPSGSLQSVSRVPSSFNAKVNASSSFEKARVPSFQVSR
ncbi:MAG: hypothetical protein HEEMFOPI_00707 [Holosporales bacterium]